MTVLDQTKLCNYYFEQITKIPHGSYNEEKLADYIVQFAKDRNLKYIRDDMHNVIVFKEATKGYENKDAVLIQAHIDMVNEKDKDSNHDFSKDPLDLYIENGWLGAKGTTLGADDGVGVAYMLAILDSKDCKHPALECVFTTQEEAGLKGADFLDTSSLKATRMIGLDGGNETSTCISSSGVIDETISKAFTLEMNTAPAYILEIDGLAGGHSGSEIHKGKANSIKVLSRILYYFIEDGIDFKLVDIKGGSKKNAIPRNSSCIFTTSNDVQDMIQSINKSFSSIKEEYKETDPNITLDLGQCDAMVSMSKQDTLDIVNYLYLSINGLQEMSQRVEGLPIASLNCGVVETTDDKVMIYYHIRSPKKVKRLEICSQLEGVAKLCNCNYEHEGDYNGWTSTEDSQIRNAYKEFYKKKTGTELIEFATHGGLETGAFIGKMPDLDIIALGPTMEGIHSPKEKLNIESFERLYSYLTEFIETL